MAQVTTPATCPSPATTPPACALAPSNRYPLDWIAERKSYKDLSSSIMDGRQKSQSWRLGECGLRRVAYILEGSAEQLGGAWEAGREVGSWQQGGGGLRGAKAGWTMDGKLGGRDAESSWRLSELLPPSPQATWPVRT